MRIYEASIRYNLISEGKAVALNSPELVAEYLRSGIEATPLQETFWVVLLNRKNYPLGRHMVSLGTLTSSLVHPREVLRAAILGGASAVIVAHNHPSGDPAPSSADITVTKQLRVACEAIDIPLLDHVIVGEAEVDPRGTGWYSFRQAGLI